jgi:hypothetical protein
MKNIIKQLLRENLFSEEYDSSNKTLYGYHVTGNNPKSLESIKANGFYVGLGKMEGQGVYGFYNLDRACGYSSKEGGTNRIIKFQITDLNRILILDMDIAKEMLGDDYHIANQLDKIFGLDYCFEDAKKVARDFFKTKEIYIEQLNKMENMESRWIGVELFTCHTLVFEGLVNVINYGSYGLQYRINDVEIAKPIGYYDLERFTKNILKYEEFN